MATMTFFVVSVVVCEGLYPKIKHFSFKSFSTAQIFTCVVLIKVKCGKMNQFIIVFLILAFIFFLCYIKKQEK